LTVTFTDTSSGEITDRCWDFVVEDGPDCVAGGSGTGAQATQTYQQPGTYTARMTVSGPGGSDAAEMTIDATASAPTASFSATPTSGLAPLEVTFTDTSSGDITGYSWDFGDGSNATKQSPVHTFSDPGQYTIALTVSGPGGASTATGSLSVSAARASGSQFLEAREIAVDTVWRRVDFMQTFTDPIVVATPLSTNDPDPALVRIRNIDPSGFDISLQEWDYQDGIHDTETIGVLAVERGSHILPNGARLEAGRFSTDNTEAFAPVSFGHVFATPPVVLSSVTSFNGGDAVVTRHSGITTSRFEVLLQEQEANTLSHVAEDIDYVAWEPSSGTIEGLAYEVARTPPSVNHREFWIDFPLFTGRPVFLASMQSTYGPDTANLRHFSLGPTGAMVRVVEEQSQDSEVEHTTESVGYVAIETDSPPLMTEDSASPRD
jgi:PKD repeat protein